MFPYNMYQDDEETEERVLKAQAVEDEELPRIGEYRRRIERHEKDYRPRIERPW